MRRSARLFQFLLLTSSCLALPGVARRLAPPAEIRPNDQALVAPTQQVQLFPVLLSRVLTKADIQGRVDARARLAAVADGVLGGAVCLFELLGGPRLLCPTR